MATMMNGYHYDMAKDGANEYAVRVNGFDIISKGNFTSSLHVFKYIDESIENSRTLDTVCLVKEYDAKTKSFDDEVVRDNEKTLEKIRALK